MHLFDIYLSTRYQSADVLTDAQLWTTLFVLSYLESDLSDLKIEWTLLAAKARGWIVQHLNTHPNDSTNVEAIYNKISAVAKQKVTQLVGSHWMPRWKKLSSVNKQHRNFDINSFSYWQLLIKEWSDKWFFVVLIFVYREWIFIPTLEIIPFKPTPPMSPLKVMKSLISDYQDQQTCPTRKL